MESQKAETTGPTLFRVSPYDLTTWKRAMADRQPVLVHLNADTTWLLQVPYPWSPPGMIGRTHFTILIDPWLRGPQSDVASWFSTQWHVVPPCVDSIDQLNSLLHKLEESEPDETHLSLIDAVVISHEFTDHCHKATLLELHRDTPVFATDKAAELIRSWSHFTVVETLSAFSGDDTASLERSLYLDRLPPWLGIGRIVTADNALYYHSAVMVAFDRNPQGVNGIHLGGGTIDAVIYSPHGVKGSDLRCVKEAGIRTLALLHGLHDVRIWMTKQLNLGAINGLEAVRACEARYWVATHDEAKLGGGMISCFLQRTGYTLRDAVEAEGARQAESEGARQAESASADSDSETRSPAYAFVELKSSEGLVLVT